MVTSDTRFARNLVFEAMRNAADNGYHFDGWSTEAIARDMRDCDTDVEQAANLYDTTRFVQEWLQRFRKNKYRKGGE